MIRNERGLTLMELTVVFVLASLVMVGLVGFYLNSQATWIDGSTEAQTQREMTLLVETMADSIHAADHATVASYPAGDPLRQMVTLYANGTPWYTFWWSSSDSLIHGGLGPGIGGPLSRSRVNKIQMQSIGDTLIVLSLLEARSSTGQVMRTTSHFVAYNR
jgi:Flp pilus assembly pilin Flp